jgi:hypothetical protein
MADNYEARICDDCGSEWRSYLRASKIYAAHKKTEQELEALQYSGSRDVGGPALDLIKLRDDLVRQAYAIAEAWVRGN